MAKRNKTTRTRIRKASSYVDNVKRTESDETRKENIGKMLAGQEFVDTWNTHRVGKMNMNGADITEHFKNIQLESGMVIQMFMENPIKYISRDSETKEPIHIDYYLRQIDARKRTSDAAHWVPTPFPVIDKGIIMAISPATKLWYYEQQEKLAKYDPAAAKDMLIPEVGDTVYTNMFQLKDARYYIDKQKKCEDLVKNQVEIRLNQFNFLFKIENFNVESIIKKGTELTMADTQVAIDSRYIEIEPEQEDVDLTVNLIEKNEDK